MRTRRTSPLPALHIQNSPRKSVVSVAATVGIFGTLLYAGHDWVDAKLGRRSMELMATEVMPRINKAIGVSAAAE